MEVFTISQKKKASIQNKVKAINLDYFSISCGAHLPIGGKAPKNP